ncbi:iron-containing alcohol dehydrogenase family protein [Halobacterium sp. KA-6]|uniref:iron-containing alcohol dehydrogenase family protein n=1 Tax=Halobacterium sp. KA-6 TaxID=2896368 RepID=UPI001E4D45FA|nr:iron-containing alcohol dehydrogenase family protein [Halobacterium sp. KA-6]MCD2204049.1 iron-containing alcohol dehydrogenase [Halobacterium sp. KA-6]
MDDESFTFEYAPPAMHHGPGIVANLETVLRQQGLSRALIITGSTIAATPAVLDPVRDGLGSSLIDVFAEVTPEKYLQTAYEGAHLVREKEIDALVPVGGGSSLDTAKIISVLAGHDCPLDAVTGEILAREEMLLPPADRALPELFAIPTTLPGADLSQVAGVKLSMEPEETPLADIPSGGVGDQRLMPTAVFYDTELVATTPKRILARSAMNGFDKGIEMLYSSHRTPITDATAMRGLRLLQAGLPSITDEATSEAALAQVLQGTALVQYGLSTPRTYRVSIIHAFGHALTRRYPIQQGVAHAIAAPHVLDYLFATVDGRRDLLAEALNVGDGARCEQATAEAVVNAVAAVRNELELPARLRNVAEAKQHHFPELAVAVIEDAFMSNAPPDLNPDPSELEEVFASMW